MAFVIEFFFYIIMEIIMYWVGRIAVAVFSLGHARYESAGEIFGNKAIINDNKNISTNVPAGVCQIIGAIVFTLSLMIFFKLI